MILPYLGDVLVVAELAERDGTDTALHKSERHICGS